MAFAVKIFFTFFFGVCALETANSSNILGFFPSPSRSHYIVHEAYMKGLAAKGHNVSKMSMIKTERCQINDCVMCVGDGRYGVSNGQIEKNASKLS